MLPEKYAPTQRLGRRSGRQRGKCRLAAPACSLRPHPHLGEKKPGGPSEETQGEGLRESLRPKIAIPNTPRQTTQESSACWNSNASLGDPGNTIQLGSRSTAGAAYAPRGGALDGATQRAGSCAEEDAARGGGEEDAARQARRWSLCELEPKLNQSFAREGGWGGGGKEEVEDSLGCFIHTAL